MFKKAIAILITALTVNAWANSVPTQAQVEQLQENLDAKALMYKSQAQLNQQTSTMKSAQYHDYANDVLQQSYQKVQQMAAAAGGDDRPDIYNGTMIFVTLSMPTENLREILNQANQYGIPVVIRGFVKNNYQDTAKRMAQILIPKSGQKVDGGFVIDPNWFTMYGIEKVPAFVMTNQTMPCKTEDANCVMQDYDVLYGNITVQDALKIFAKKSQFAQKAQEMLNKEKNHVR